MDVTIVTNCRKIAEAIQGLGQPAVYIEPGFIKLAAEPFNERFELQFCTVDVASEAVLRGLRGTVVCAIPPGLRQGEFLFDVIHTAREGRMAYAPVHWVRPSELRRALGEATEVDPWFLTSIAAFRAVHAVLGRRLMPLWREPKVDPLKWQSLFYLQLIRDVHSPAWMRCLYFGSCRAPEIDCFGGIIHHRRRPACVAGPFQITQQQSVGHWPEPRQRLNQLLRHGTLSIEASGERLESAFRSGFCSWPFSHGEVAYGEPLLEILPEARPALPDIPVSKPAQKVTRLYSCDKFRFRSLSYYLEGEEINPMPARAPIRAAIEPDLPQETVEGLLDRLDGYRLSLDLPDLLALSPRYIHVSGRKLTITPLGHELLRKAEEAGVTFARLYLVLRLLENIQSDEASYLQVLQLVTKMFQERLAPTDGGSTTMGV